MTYYYRVRLGAGGVHAEECLREGYIGVGYGVHEDFARALQGSRWEFNERCIPLYQAAFPDKSKLTAGQACGAIYTTGRGIAEGDIVLSPDASGQKLRAGEVAGPYYYEPGTHLCHRRPVRWFDHVIDKAEISDSLKASVDVPLSVIYLEHHGPEVERLLKGATGPTVAVTGDATVEDPAAFAMEQHLEAFLVANWANTELGREWDIASSDGEMIGQQYQTDSGPLDILAVSKDGARLLVVELKKGRASDVVVGQILRYMGYVKSEVAEPHQSVEGVIIALEDDHRLRHAISIVPSISFYRYAVRFQLVKA